MFRVELNNRQVKSKNDLSCKELKYIRKKNYRKK